MTDGDISMTLTIPDNSLPIGLVHDGSSGRLAADDAPRGRAAAAGRTPLAATGSVTAGAPGRLASDNPGTVT